MSKFKKYYNETFNNIHATQEVKNKIIDRAKNLKTIKSEDISPNDTTILKDNLVNETFETDIVSKTKHNFKIAIPLVCSVALVGVLFFGYNYFYDTNPLLEDSTIPNQVGISSTQPDLNSNFYDIFKTPIENLDLKSFSYTSNFNIGGQYNNLNVINKALNNFDTIQWKSSGEFNPVDNGFSEFCTLTLDYLNTETNLDETIKIYVLSEKLGTLSTDSLYLSVSRYSIINDEIQYYVEPTYYQVDYNTVKNLLNILDNNNYLYFNVNPSNRLDISVNDQDFSITDQQKISKIKENLFDNFNWQLQSLPVGLEKVMSFNQKYDDITYNITLFKNSNELFAQVSIENQRDSSSNYMGFYRLSTDEPYYKSDINKNYDILLKSILD